MLYVHARMKPVIYTLSAAVRPTSKTCQETRHLSHAKFWFCHGCPQQNWHLQKNYHGVLEHRTTHVRIVVAYEIVCHLLYRRSAVLWMSYEFLIVHASCSARCGYMIWSSLFAHSSCCLRTKSGCSDGPILRYDIAPKQCSFNKPLHLFAQGDLKVYMVFIRGW